MNRIFLILQIISFFIPSPVKAHQPFCAGDTAYVAAISGLKLRLHPTKTSESILVMDFGSPVLIEELFEDRTDKAGWTEGIWLRINYDGVSGFAFSGFLSPVPVPSPRLESSEFALSTLLEGYTLRNFSPVQSTDTVEYHTGLDKYFHVKRTHTLADGVKVERHTYWNCDQVDVYLPNARAMDGYHLIRAFITPYQEQFGILEDLIFIEGEENNIKQVDSRYLERVHICEKGNGRLHISVRDFYTSP